MTNSNYRTPTEGGMSDQKIKSPLWKSWLLLLSATDMKLIQKYPNCINRQLLFGALLLFSASLISVSAFSITGLVLKDHLFARVIITFITVSMVVLIDQLVMGSVSRLSALVRLPMVFLFSFLVMLAIIKHTSEDKIYDVIRETKKEESGDYTRLASLTERRAQLELSIQENEDLSQALYRTYYNELNGFDGTDQCYDYQMSPETGELIPEPRSCPRAYSSYQAWNAKTVEVDEQRALLQTLDYEIHDLRISEPDIDPGFTSFFAGFFLFVSSEPVTAFVVLIIGLLYLFLETAPLFSKLASRSELNEYDAERLIRYKARKEVVNLFEYSSSELQKSHRAWFKDFIKDKDFNNDNDFKSLKNALTNFKGILDSWRNSINKMEPTEEANSSKDDRPDESVADAGKNGQGKDEEEDIPVRSESVPVIRRGNNMSALKIIVTIIAVLALLELTMISPIQRVTGLAVASFPGLFLNQTSLKKFNDLSNFSGPPRFRQILSDEGDILYSAGIRGTISDNFKKFLLTSENHRYRRTYCVDVIRGGGATLDLISGSPSGGASSIPMQLARGSVLKRGLSDFSRKIMEILIGCALRYKLGSEKLLEAYISTVFLGGDIHGFPAGSWEYFGKPLNELNPSEATALIAILNAPNDYVKDEAYYQARYERVLDMFHNQKLLDERMVRRLKENRPDLGAASARRETLAYQATRHAVSLMLSDETLDEGVVRSSINTSISVSAFRVLNTLAARIGKMTNLSDIDGFVLISQNGNLLSAIGSRFAFGTNNLNKTSAWRPASLVKPLLLNEYITGSGEINDLLPNTPQCFGDNEDQWCVSNSTSHFLSTDYIRASQALSASPNVPFAYLADQGVLERLNDRLESNDILLFSDYNANALGAEAVVPLSFFRVIQAYSEPYGVIPAHFNWLQENLSESLPLFPAETSETIAATLYDAVVQPYGTLHNMKKFGWNATGAHYIGKTGTGQNHTSAGVFVVRPGGIVLLMGLFSRSGAPMISSKGIGVTGADLAEYVDVIMKNPEIIKSTRFKEFSFNVDWAIVAYF